MMKIHNNKIQAAMLAAVALPAGAADQWLTGDYLTGDWGGKRGALEARGYSFFANYTAIVASNVSGGIDSGTAYAGDLYLGMRMDLEKILGWNGWSFNLTGIDRHGASIDENVGGIYSVMQLVGGQTYFLYGVSLEKTWLDGRHAFKFGRITATDDFAGSPFYSYYLSNSINGQIRAVLLDGVMTSYPFPVWGARYQYAPTDDFRAKIGVYQLTERMWDPDLHGTDFAFRSSDGVSVMAQLEWDWRWNAKPGHVGVGLNNVYFDMANFDSSDGHRQLHPLLRPVGPAGHPGVGGLQTGALSVRHAGLHQSAGAGPGALPDQPRRAVRRSVRGARPGSSDLRHHLRQTERRLCRRAAALGNGDPDYEWIFELGYRVQLTKFVYIQPDLQYVVQPGGTGEIPDATVLGMQFGVSL